VGCVGAVTEQHSILSRSETSLCRASDGSPGMLLWVCRSWTRQLQDWVQRSKPPPRRASYVVAGSAGEGMSTLPRCDELVVERSEPSPCRSSFVVAGNAAGGVGETSCLSHHRSPQGSIARSTGHDRHGFPCFGASAPPGHARRHSCFPRRRGRRAVHVHHGTSAAVAVL